MCVRSRVILGLQLLGTLAILIFVPTNWGKLIAFLALWYVTFRPLSRLEVLFYLIACAFFFTMDALTLQKGIFAFAHPDFLRMPMYEPFVWGFYLLHTLRMLRGPVPVGRAVPASLLAAALTVAFGTIVDPGLLFEVTVFILLLGLVFFHEPHDWAYLGYMVLLGALIEYTGVFFGEWSYPEPPAGGVPLWFVTLWGGVGLVLRSLILPVLARLGWCELSERGGGSR